MHGAARNALRCVCSSLLHHLPQSIDGEGARLDLATQPIWRRGTANRRRPKGWPNRSIDWSARSIDGWLNRSVCAFRGAPKAGAVMGWKSIGYAAVRNFQKRGAESRGSKRECRSSRNPSSRSTLYFLISGFPHTHVLPPHQRPITGQVHHSVAAPLLNAHNVLDDTTTCWCTSIDLAMNRTAGAILLLEPNNQLRQHILSLARPKNTGAA